MFRSRFKGVLAALLLCAGSAQAENLVALTDAGHLISFDSANPAVITGDVALSGVPFNGLVMGLDYRATTGRLVLIVNTAGSGMQLYDVNPATGTVSPRGASIPNIVAYPATTPAGQTKFFPGEIDVDPLTDTLRVVGSMEITANGVSAISWAGTVTVPYGGAGFFRADLDTGVRIQPDNLFIGDGVPAGEPATPVTIDQCWPCSGVRGVGGIAHRYIPADGGAGRLTLYGVAAGSLVRIGSLHGAPDPADSGRYVVVGPLGITISSIGPYGGSTPFDISAPGNAYVVTNDPSVPGSFQSYLRTVDLDTGAAGAPLAIGDALSHLIELTAAPGITPGQYTPGSGGGGGSLSTLGLLGLLGAALAGLRRSRFLSAA